MQNMIGMEKCVIQHGLKRGLIMKKEQIDFLPTHIATMLVGNNKNFWNCSIK